MKARIGIEYSLKRVRKIRLLSRRFIKGMHRFILNFDYNDDSRSQYSLHVICVLILPLPTTPSDYVSFRLFSRPTESKFSPATFLQTVF